MCFIHKFVLAIFLGPKADKMGAESRGLRVEEYKHPIESGKITEKNQDF